MKKILILVTLAVAVALGFSAARLWLKPQPIELEAATWFGDQARKLPAFELTDHNHKAFNNRSLQGKWTLMFFGYTHCPDICPDTLQVLADTMRQIDNEAIRQQLQIVFISVDPERDTLDAMKAYVGYFNPAFLSATADIEQVKLLTDAVGVLHYIVKSDEDDRYEVAHSAVMPLIDPKGRYTAIFSAPHNSEMIAADLKRLIQP